MVGSEDFYPDPALEDGGPVLDLGCGTAMLACGIAAKGLGVTGVDWAEAMLHVARTRPGGDRVNWIKSDGQSLDLPRRFNFVYMTGHAFQQLLTDDDAATLLRAAVAHLNPYGRFVFETRNPGAQAWLSWTPDQSKRTIQSPKHGRVSLFYEAQADPANGIVTIGEHYHLLDQGVRRVGRNRIRFIDREQVARLVTKGGLAAVEWYGDWAGGPLSSASNEIIVVTRRVTLAATGYER